MEKEAHCFNSYHPVLLRQLRRARMATDGSAHSPQVLHEFLSKVSETYRSGEEDRYLLERSLDLSSQEMQALNSRLESERSRLNSVLETTEDCVCTLDDDGRVTWANPAALQLLGFRDDRVSEFRFLEQLKPMAGEMDDEALGINSRHKRAILCNAEGRELPIAYIRNQISSVSQSGSSVVIFRDIRAEVAREEALCAARKAARSASEMKSQLLANVSHEVRTPLHGILGMIQVMLMEGKLNCEQADYLGNMKSSAEGLLSVLNDILDMSKVEAGRIDLESIAFSPQALIEEVQRLLSAQAKAKGLTIQQRICPQKVPRVIGDPNRLRQVLMNLTSNAVKFTQFGFVEIALEWQDSGPGQAELEFHVRDTGIGIAADKHDTIFEPFAQADGSITRRFGGTGLGLAICSQLVRLMGSEIRVKSTPGLGSDFRFTLRMPTDQQAHPAFDPVPELKLMRLRLLYAEDNLINQLTARKLLSAHGHTVQVVGNGRAAVEAAQSESFDVILMDHQMPELSGIEATRRIRDLGIRTPIIAVSADAMADVRAQFLRSGMDGFVGKPFKISDLEAEIARVLQLQLV